MELGLDGRTAVVLASTAGLGRAVAQALLREGARVAVSGRDPARLADTRRELEARYSDRVLGAALDVRDARAMNEHLDAVRSAFGPIDILVWNSGGPPAATASEIGEAELEAAYRTLLEAAVRTIRNVLPSMRARKFGRILAMTSVAVRQPILTLALSNTMRSGLTAYLKSLSLEVARDGVLVNSICTGMFDTERLRALLEARASAVGRTLDEERALTCSEIPLGRLGRPEEFGDFVAFLASERASYLTGAALPIDGGASRSLL